FLHGARMLAHPFLCPMVLRLPSSTLFPYTTLFRSRLMQFLNRVPHPPIRGTVLLVSLRVSGQSELEVLPSTEDWTLCAENHYQEDRKSTRLNSSHVKISYAVFCLKKKKKGLKMKKI